MPKTKFSCGHKAYGKECPICKDLEKGYLILDGAGKLRTTTKEEKQKAHERKAAEVKNANKPLNALLKD